MNASRGFTLLELMVALVLAALVAALALDGLRVAARTWEGVARGSGAALDLRLAEVFLRSHLEEAQPAAFSGEADTLSFVAALPAPLGAGAMHRFTLARAAAPEGGRLVLGYRPYPDEEGPAGGAAPPASAILAAGVQAIDFAYFGVPAAGRPAAWSARWEEGNGLPQLVRARVQLAGAQAAREIIVAPRLTTAPPP